MYYSTVLMRCIVASRRKILLSTTEAKLTMNGLVRPVLLSAEGATAVWRFFLAVQAGYVPTSVVGFMSKNTHEMLHHVPPELDACMYGSI